MIENPPGSTPEELLAAAGRGEEQALADLYSLLSARVHGLALRMLRDRHLAEEVTQEVFLQVWQHSRRFDADRGTALSWIMTMAHRRAVDRVRSTARSRGRDQEHAAEQVLWQPYDETATRAVASVEAESVRTALATLTAGQRRAIELAYFDGYTHVEISGLMQCPVGTAKGRIRDGLNNLRDRLVGIAPEPA